MKTQMNRRKAIGGILAGAAATAPMAMAAGPAVDIWVDRWKKAKAFTLAVAEAMPADKYNFKPAGIADEVRTFGEQMVHLGEAEGFYLGRLGTNGRPPMTPKTFTKDVVVPYLTSLFDWSIGAINDLSDADLTKTYGNGKMASTGLDLLLNAFVHTAHTRGYSEMYIRAAGVKPPPYGA